MSPHHQFRRSAALCLMLAAGTDLSLDTRFETATVSGKLDLIRAEVTALSRERGLPSAPVKEAGYC